ncbi:MAG TPA: matrixin family metalloprotease [Syntrophorhabdales bacterium]|nr:matrixin family metalloprotease [Syntrophorhabdales bacterium]
MWVERKNKLLTLLLCFFLCTFAAVPTGRAAGLFSEVTFTGYGWGKPEVTVTINPKPGAEIFAEDVVTVVTEWNNILQKIRGAPALTVVSGAKADIIVIISPTSGEQLGSAALSSAVQNSCVLSGVAILLHTKALDRTYSHAGLRNVARHEFAHALGLGHSNDKNEQMFPYADEDIFFGAEDIHPSECEAKGLALMYPMRPYCVMPEKVNCF